jgi:hypothetical protein
MKLRLLIKWFIPIVIVLVFAVYFFLSLYDQSTNYEIEQEKPVLKPQAKMKLKDVMYLKWDKDVYNISNALPGGKLTQFKSDGREMNLYMINALLTDVDSNAKVSFQRNENNSGKLVTHKWVQLEVSSTDEIEKKYEQIINTLSSYGMKIMNLGKSDYADSTFHLEDADGSGGIQLDFRNDVESMKIRINVTRYQIINEQ